MQAELALKIAHKQAEEGASVAQKCADEEELARAAAEATAVERTRTEQEAAASHQVAREAEEAAKKSAEEAALARKALEEAQKKADELAAAAAAARAKANQDAEVAQEQASTAATAKSKATEDAATFKVQQQIRQDFEKKKAHEDSTMVATLKEFCREFGLGLATSKEIGIEFLENYLVKIPGTETYKRKAAQEERAKKEAEEAALAAKREAEAELAKNEERWLARLAEQKAKKVEESKVEPSNEVASEARPAEESKLMPSSGFQTEAKKIEESQSAPSSEVVSEAQTVESNVVPGSKVVSEPKRVEESKAEKAEQSNVVPNNQVVSPCPQLERSVVQKQTDTDDVSQRRAAEGLNRDSAKVQYTVVAVPSADTSQVEGSATQRIPAAPVVAVPSADASHVEGSATQQIPAAPSGSEDCSHSKEELDKYLPLQLNGVTVMEPDTTGIWRATNHHLRSASNGLGYRRSKDLNARLGSSDYLAWGKSVAAVDVGDGWLQMRTITQEAQMPSSSSLGTSESLSSTAPDKDAVPVDQSTPEKLDEGRAAFASGALSRQSELASSLAASRDELERKVLEVEAAKQEHSSVLKRHLSAEEAAQHEMKRLRDECAAAKEVESTCAADLQKTKALRASFVGLQENPSKKAEQSANALKPQLKITGLNKKVLDSVPPLLAKKRPNQSDKKVLTSVVEALDLLCRQKESALGNSRAKVKTVQDALGVLSAAEQARAEELLGSEAASKAKELEKTSCEDKVNLASRELLDHEDRMGKEGLMRFNSSSTSCVICCDDIDAFGAVMLGCGHGHYCTTCVARHVDERLERGTAGDVPCPECPKAIPEKDLVRVLPKQTIIRLHARSIEMVAVAAGALQRSCPTPDCKMRHTFKEGASGSMICYMCGKESCWLCGTQPFHEGLTCEQYAKRLKRRGLSKDEDSFYQWMEATGTRQCPKCQMATSKENLERQTEQRAECHKMQCRNCGTRFCFKCLALLTDTYTCGCTKNKHGFIDPKTGEFIGHLKRGKGKRSPTK
jgi:hypothetical protein